MLDNVCHDCSSLREFLCTLTVTGARLGGETKDALHVEERKCFEAQDDSELLEEVRHDLRSLKSLLPSLGETDDLAMEVWRYDVRKGSDKADSGADSGAVDAAWGEAAPAFQMSRGLSSGGATRHRIVLRDNIQNITKHQIQALAAQAGVLAFDGGQLFSWKLFS